MRQHPAMPDLSLRPDTALEWWFVQGQFQGDDLATHSFMLSLFRQHGHNGDGHMAIAATLDHATKQHNARSQVSPQFVKNFLVDAPEQLKTWDFEPKLVETFINELKESGVPAPVRLDTCPVTIASQPISLDWADLSFRQIGSRITITFELPENGNRCSFELTPKSGWLTDNEVGGAAGVGVMGYHSCPRLVLEGSVGANARRGNAWIDHQWGGFGWFKGEQEKHRLLGWDWFGINLTDGMDLLVLVNRDMRTGHKLFSTVKVFVDGQQQTSIQDISLTATRYWLSPETMVDYPVAWTIEIPALSARLTFEPLADNQEIEIFGFIGAIWEGAGTIKGEIAGKPVAGQARLELQGYGFINNVKAYQARWAERSIRPCYIFSRANLMTYN